MAAKKTSKKTKVKYIGPTGNATAALLSGRYETPLAQPGKSYRFKVKISKSPKARNRRAKANSLITLTSKKEPTARDQIAYKALLQ